ncbi:recombinase family protein [Nocardia gipuzkoensis]|uniref:recombinase family protein n=1 Tax=Nocardia gipuzkoensis TaxID=2749991 RepID=UPI001E4CE7D8|nr:recombinase family protein [Nocardia gipuzkoensis]UGT71856.1 recombinase family protein [Nocardia gipuzkoensis]
MKRAAVYLRQSEDRDDDQLAISRQREDCHMLCAQRGWDPVDYVDNDTSAVGMKRKRPSWDQMLADIDAGIIQAVVCWDLDRLYREPIDLEYLIPLADRMGIALATVTGDVDLSTDNGRMIARIKGAVARAEIDRRSARQKRKMRQLAEAGETWTSRRPFGYNLDDTTVPEELAAVTEAYQMILAGHSLMSIVRAWNALGLKSTLGNEFKSQVSIRKILQNPRYAGLRAYNGEILGKAKWPAAVTEDVYRAVCDILADPTRRSGTSTGRVYLLTGIALCGLCGAAMDVTGTTRTRRPAYRCRGCFKTQRQVDLADDHVTELAVARLSRPDAEDLLVDQNRPDIEKLRREAAAMREKLKTIATKWADDLLTDEQVSAMTKRAKARLDAATSAMEDANRARLFKGVVGKDAGEFRGLLLDRRRAIVDALMVVTFQKASGPGKFDPESIRADLRM